MGGRQLSIYFLTLCMERKRKKVIHLRGYVAFWKTGCSFIHFWAFVEVMFLYPGV
jgi:hypothetical protein